MEPSLKMDKEMEPSLEKLRKKWSQFSRNGERYAFGVKINNTGSPDFLTGGNYCITDSPLAPYQIVLNLAANDYVELFYFSAVSTTLGGSTHWLYWGGYLLG